MHYYGFNIGDYRRDTGHLSTLEHGIYRQLLDWCYLEETPIPEETQVVMRRLRLVSKSEQQSLLNVLSDFFDLRDDGYHQLRCEAEIQHYHRKAGVNKTNGKLGGRPKKTQPVILANPTESESKANKTLTQEPNNPITNINTGTNVPVGKAALPACELQSVVDLYHEALPELPAVRLMNDSRKRAISSMWKFVLTSKKSDNTPRATTGDEAKEWLKGYFLRARENDFLMGRSSKASGHEGWVCDFDFLLSEKGKKQVIEKTQAAA